ncbi:uncharacterized protein LOC132696321 [Cylas formicarius]|uniref:uncharacterized protein LOC132696321 n=1 Tax=Cylas formicarius TaxID=197179 RepID=UPI002958A20D|nr:uncharacterized protein LOC132696321 [Cylas formicarius]
MRETSSRKSRIPVRIKRKFVLKDGGKLEMQSKMTQKAPNPTSFESRVNDRIVEVSLESSLATSGSSLVTLSTSEHVSIEALDDSFDVNYTGGLTSGQSQTGRQCYDGDEASAGVELIGTTNLKPEECDPLKSAYHEEEKDGVEPAETSGSTTNELEKDEFTHESRHEKEWHSSVPVCPTDTITSIALKKQKPTATSSKQRSRGSQSVDVVPPVNNRRGAANRKREKRVSHVGSGSGTVPTRYGIVCDKNAKGARCPSNESVIKRYRGGGDEMKDGHLLVVPEITVAADVCHSASVEINIGESGDLKFRAASATKKSGENVVCGTRGARKMLDKCCENVSCEESDGSSNGNCSEQVLPSSSRDAVDVSGDDWFQDVERSIGRNGTTMSIDGETESPLASTADGAERGVPSNLLNDPPASRQDEPREICENSHQANCHDQTATWKSENVETGGTSATNAEEILLAADCRSSKTIPDDPSSTHGDPCASDGVPETASSIGVGVVGCATSLSCSLVCTAKGSASFACDCPNSQDSSPSAAAVAAVKKCRDDKLNVCDSTVGDTVPKDATRSDGVVERPRKREQLCWSFRNGRLVFDAVEEEEDGKSDLDGSRHRREQVVDAADILYSKDINKRPDEGRSRLKRLGCKLKEAGLTDDNLGDADVKRDLEGGFARSGSFEAHAYDLELTEDSPRETVVPKYIDYDQFQRGASFETKGVLSLDSNQNVVNEDDGDPEDLIPEESHGFSQFDVSTFPGFLDDESDACSDCEEEEEHYIVIKRGKMRGDGSGLSETVKHNPDRDNLKSLLKKPGRGKEKKPNRVVFNENKNEFFDADYIILIREECDYDDEDDDGICTCNQHEIVRLTCCEPNCNCNQGYDGFDQTPPSPKFAPPIEFVDAVTLSPPEGYKDLELGEEQLMALQQMARRSQRTAVCRECSASQEEAAVDEGDGSQSDGEIEGQTKEQEEKEKTDQSQQTTPTTPPNSESPSSQKYILETITMTTVTQQQILREAEEEKKHLSQNSQFPNGSPIAGILKGGRLWKQQSNDGNVKISEQNLTNAEVTTSDDESGSKRSVRFIESTETKEKRDVCDGAPETSLEEGSSKQLQLEPTDKIDNAANKHPTENSSSPESTEMMLTFKLGSHVLISNNSLKPNSAVRQLFPCAQSLAAAQGVREEENSQQYLVTAESLRAFEEAKRSKLPQIVHTGENDENIKRAIERNTLRRSLIRYEPRSKKQAYKTDNSLVERIKQLTCDVDDNVNHIEHQPSESSTETSEDVPDSSRSSPPGEESRNSPDVSTLVNKSLDKSFSPSSSSTSSSNSSSMSSASNYHHLRKLGGDMGMLPDGKHRLDTIPDIQNNYRRDAKPLPDIGGPHNHEATDPSRPHPAGIPDLSHCAISNKISSSSTSSESRRQFLSTLAPLTACVSMGIGHGDDYYYHLSNSQPCDRVSVASSGTEYSLEDIDEGLKNEEEDHKRIAPDVLVGTPSASESGDELALFVQQDASRIERIKKKYQPVEQPQKDKDEDDEHDDYGFNKRPSVRGIKPRFGTTTEILQQIQNQLQPPLPPPARMAWPYYSESGLTDNSKQKNANPAHHPSAYHYGAPQYRPTSLQDESLYQNCANQRCASRDIYQQRGNANVYSSVVRMGNDYYHSLPRQRNGRPQSPPPMDMSKSFHQTMVYIPYNHIEGYQPVAYYHHTGNADYVTRVSSQNQINKRYVEPIYQSRTHQHPDEHHYNSNAVPPIPPKPVARAPYHGNQPPPHILASNRSESPLPGQFSTARSTQTSAPVLSTCGYYPTNPRYRPMINPVWPGEANYVTKLNRHSFPSVGPRYAMPDSMSLTDSDSTHSGSLVNGYRQSGDPMMGSPTKSRFIERGVPEGAASVQPQDVGGGGGGSGHSNSGTMTSPTSPQNPPVPTPQKPMFYAMNV